MPPVDSGTQRSRGIESMTTVFVAGMTLTRIIDWVSTWSPRNFESSSDPSSSTVKAPTCWGELGDEVGEKSRPDGEGDAISTTWPVAWTAV